MHIDPAQIERLISELEAIRMSAYWMETEFEAELSKVAESSREGARNLLHYLALRRRDNRSLQAELASLGLSSLGRAESHVLGTIDPVLSVLHGLLGRKFKPKGGLRPIGYLEGRVQLANHTEALFGRGGAGSGDDAGPARIMVTMPLAAAESYDFVLNLVESGMSCMRINCAHDGPDVWAAMVAHLRRACTETGRECRLAMDLAGPKIRTGPMEPGPRVVRWEPKRDIIGEVIRPALIWLTPVDAPEPAPPEATATVPLDRETLSRLRLGDKIVFRDARGRSRKIVVREQRGASWTAESGQITYLSSDCSLRVHSKNGEGGATVPFNATPDGITPVEQHLMLRAGDTLHLIREPTPGRPIGRNADGQLLEEPWISCAVPEILDRLELGERIIFDDGKISGTVIGKTPQGVRVRITQPVVGEKKLRAFKGINFPESDLDLPAVTAKDLQDLDFVVKHADIVAISFVNRPTDIEQLQREIDRRTSRQLGIILKIETRRGFAELPRLLLTAMRSEPVGVMIARGDLAVEVGWERLAEIQEEILWLCEAAHVPVIWATQVLERLAKKGMPTRAEITDAAMAEQAECVMLNKGPHMVETVRVLRDILGRMRSHRDKKSPMLRALQVSSLRPEPRGASRGS